MSVVSPHHYWQFSIIDVLPTLYPRTDYVLTQDKSFKKHAKAYADSQDLWFKDFASVVARLFELGVPPEQFVSPEPWVMPTVDEQNAAKEKN